ncbi:hypothetical protein A2Z33_07400 [Candidatus Gottesmanbacteria bacterium RBG_16_52_11]|uniref:Uncharacterized protein n=1 Tax=Candidatus Gottesmanbacteria bacterium RBG_16_52_11 TaxID=1798374 RepID=A0A1F5YYP0_9BACT|nr:MAG: hypothetical protein A2Z33_07400 [Candidatus Gottesmanbacteria bacterium RBG_16_52_11]
MGTRKLIAFLILLFLVIAGIYGIYLVNRSRLSAVNTFDECVSMGYPILESYPRKCITPDGRSLTEAAGNVQPGK